MRTWIGSITLVAAMLPLMGCNAAPAAVNFKPIADMKQLMDWIIDPAADVVWGSVGTIIDANGVNEFYPKTDEEWTAVRNAAAIVAESSNLMMMPSRAKDNTDWIEFSQGLADAAVLAMRAADARDKEALFDAGGRIYAVCSACHQQYIDEIRESGSR